MGTVHVQYGYSPCTVWVQSMYSMGTVHVHYGYSPCTLCVQSVWILLDLQWHPRSTQVLLLLWLVWSTWTWPWLLLGASFLRFTSFSRSRSSCGFARFFGGWNDHYSFLFFFRFILCRERSQSFLQRTHRFLRKFQFCFCSCCTIFCFLRALFCWAGIWKWIKIFDTYWFYKQFWNTKCSKINNKIR